ncbi:hypothetical protein AGR7A_Lc120539 [Agrobacterium deltaense NCPPB 1641]|uniref:Uncharacterized protein n=1 Tax=Agrobacterium deltaense NCPPB 1641 TaxID=1183425 RepID=A0A1S7TY28_9HYPH|nr:hypothetical protein AGR7A_Lc120539 [Agrobacterium deltaense NCPPB 1641]
MERHPVGGFPYVMRCLAARPAIASIVPISCFWWFCVAAYRRFPKPIGELAHAACQDRRAPPILLSGLNRLPPRHVLHLCGEGGQEVVEIFFDNFCTALIGDPDYNVTRYWPIFPGRQIPFLTDWDDRSPWAEKNAGTAFMLYPADIDLPMAHLNLSCHVLDDVHRL